MGKVPDFIQYRGCDWLRGKVMLLAPEEVGVFAHLMAVIQANEGAVKYDQYLPRIIRVNPEVFSKAMEAITEMGIVYIEKRQDGDYLHIKFIDQQINEFLGNAENNKRNGRNGGRPKKEENRGFSEKTGGFDEKTPKNPPFSEKTGGFDEKTKDEKDEKENGVKEKEEKEENKRDKYTAPAHARGETPESIYPESVEEVIALSQDPDCANPMTREQAQAYYDYRTSTGWVTSNGIPIKRVEADIACWMRREKERMHRQRQQPFQKPQEEEFDAAAWGYAHAKMPKSIPHPPPFEPVKCCVVPDDQYEAAVAEALAEKERKAREEVSK